MGSQVLRIEFEQLGILKEPIELLQERVAGLGRYPVDRTCVTVYNHVGPPGARNVLVDTLLYPRWPPLFNSQSEISDKN